MSASKLEGSAVTKRRPPNAGKGRVKGVPNKTTVAVKQALAAAFDELGGVAALAEWARGNPDDFYKLWVKLLPTEVSGPDGGPIMTNGAITVRFIRPGDAPEPA